MPLNPNVILSTENYSENAQISGVVDDMPGYELKKMLTQNTYESARIAKPSSGSPITFKIDLGKVCPIKIVSLVKNNLSQFSTWKVLIYDRPGGSVLFESDYVPVFSGEDTYGTSDWGVFNWGGLLPEENFTNFSKYAVMPLEETYYGSCIEFYIAVNDSDKDYFECFLLWIGNGFQPEINSDYGAEIVPIDETDSRSSKSGNRVYGNPVRRKKVTLEFPGVHKSEFFRKFFGPVLQKSGISKLVLVCLAPAEADSVLYQTVCGNLENSSKATHAFWNRLDTALEIEESP